MLTDKEYPATHSMSTAWYCVDEDGNVGIIDIDDNGPIPADGYEQNCVEDVFWEDFAHDEILFKRLNLDAEQISQMLEPMDIKDIWEKEKDIDEWMNMSWMEVIVQVDMTKFDIFKKAFDMEEEENHFRPLVCISVDKGLFFVDFSFNKRGVELLEKNNFQVEKLYTIDYAITPCLFVYENDVMLIGERHYSGQFFVEMKRFWTGVSARIIAKAIEDTDTGTVSCFQYEDGSWGIRTAFYDNVFESNFEKLLNMAINEVRAVVEKIENKPGIGPEVFSVANAQRSLFIYEVIDASLKLSKLHI